MLKKSMFMFVAYNLMAAVLLAAAHDNMRSTKENSYRQPMNGSESTTASYNSWTKTQEPIYLLTLLPYPDIEMPRLNPSWSGGPNLIPALDLAAEQIRNKTDLLRNYDLRLLHGIEGCEILAKTYESFMRNMFVYHTDKNIVGIIGPSCSSSTVAVAGITAKRELNLVTVHGSGTPLLSNATQYPFALGVFGSTVGFVNTLLSLMHKNNWHKIAILYQDSRTYYRTILQQFESMLKQDAPDVEILFSSRISETFYPLSGIRNSGARIVLALAAEEHLLKIMCLAHYNSMILPFYQWLFTSEQFDTLFGDITANRAFHYDGKFYNCSANDIRHEALNGSILMYFRLTTFDNETKTDIGFSFNEFNSLYKQRVAEYNRGHVNQRYGNFTLQTTYWAHNFYDTVWAWAYVLDQLASVRGVNLSDIQYGDYTAAQLIMEEFFDLNFTGMSGQMSFNSDTRYVDRTVELYQVLNGNETLVAFTNSGDLIPMPNVSIIAIEDSIRDTDLVHPGLIAFVGVVVSVLLIVVVVLHILTLAHRNFKTIKASSIQLNQFIFIGVYLSLIGIVLFLVSERLYNEHGLCQTIWAWVVPSSFTLVYGALVARTWRLYRIFVHYRDPGPFITNPILIGFVIFLLIIDVTIAITWTVVDPLNVIPIEYRSGRKLVTTTRCWCRYYSIWHTTVILYNTAVMIAFLVLAHLTGHITHQSFTTASLRVLGYINFILYLLGIPMYAIYNILSHNPNAGFTIFCLLVIVSIILLIVLIFLPPILPLFQLARSSVPHTVSRLQ